ncbi:WYL domain-containing protein [Nocardioides sp. P5_E3]
MTAPHYVHRFARLPQVLELLAAYPDGLSIDDLAEQARVPSAEVRQDLIWFTTAQGDVAVLDRPMICLEFLSADGVDLDDASEAELVRLSGYDGLEELGVEYVTAGELALLYAAGLLQRDLDPDDIHLAEALGVLEETMRGESRSSTQAHRRYDDVIDPLKQAANEHRRVHIRYSRAWREGVTDRIIEPYRLIHARGAWEVDAGPLDENDDLRTFLLTNIRSANLLDETFTPPDDLPGRLERQRATTTVRVRLPHASRWAAGHYAETERAVAEDEEFVTLDVDLLPPLLDRAGKLMLAAGPKAELVAPAELSGAAAAVARKLLEHHSASAC